MEYIRKVDFEDVNSKPPDERVQIWLLGHNSDAKNCTVSYIKTPPGSGSPAGLHVHDIDQVFYILSGTMSIEIESETNECEPGSLIIFPAGVPHRNWNGGSEPTVHLAVNTPLPDPKVQFARSIE